MNDRNTTKAQLIAELAETRRRVSELERSVTEYRQTEEALRESEAHFRDLVEMLPEAVFETDMSLKLTYANQCSFELFGYSADDLMRGLNCFDLISPEERERAREKFAERLKGTVHGPSEYRALKKDGSTLPMLFHLVPIIDKGELAGFRGVAIDITVRKQAEEEKNKLEIQLRQAQKLETIGTLAGGIAHDFNNILTPILGYTELALLKLDKTDPIAGNLNQVLKGALRAQDLIGQILLFSRVNEKERRPLALQTLINEVLKLLRPSIPSTIEILPQIDVSCAKVRADASQIHQVVVNLCTNGWQAMEEKGGTLTIGLKQIEVDAATAKLHSNLNEAQYARLSIIDTGKGMDEMILDRIFEPFFTTKTVARGTGLGLSVVHGIVRSHRGDILVDSEPGEGSAFHVYLPIIKDEEEVVDTTSRAIAVGMECVMVVDDEPVIAEMVKMMLEKFGYKVEVFKTGPAAIEAFQQQPGKYDLLLTDLTMPQMTGLDLADQLHKEHPEFPVMIMTGYGDSLTVPTLERYGIQQIIGKPVTVKELATAVRNVLDKVKSSMTHNGGSQ